MAHFLSTLLDIRLKQAWRALKSIGWLLVLALPFGIIFLLGAWEKLGTYNSIVVGLLLTGIVTSIHLHRKDAAFLRKSKASVYLIFCIEYQLFLVLFFSLPILLISRQREGIVIAHLISLIIPLLPSGQKSGVALAIPLKWVPITLFEWRSGIRKNWILLLPIYLSGIVFSKFIAAPLASILLVLLIAISFYDELENRMLIEAEVLQSNFLMKKWLKHGLFFAVLFSPQVILFLLFHGQLWYLITALLFVCIIFIGCAIFYKYSAYLPRRQQVNNQTPMALLYVGLIIPFIAPAIFVALFIFYRKAKRRLNYFFPYAKN